MSVSSDGYCGTVVRSSGNAPILIASVTPPKHGQLTVTDSPGFSPSFRYTPEPGFIGQDNFQINTASGGAVEAKFTVDVFK